MASPSTSLEHPTRVEEGDDVTTRTSRSIRIPGFVLGVVLAAAACGSSSTPTPVPATVAPTTAVTLATTPVPATPAAPTIAPTAAVTAPASEALTPSPYETVAPVATPASSTSAAPASPVASISVGGGSLPPTACPANQPMAPGTIATVAGGGTGSPAHGGQARSVHLDLATGGIAVDPTGAIYVTEPLQADILRIGTDGVISIVAARASGAPFVQPGGIAFNASGDLLVADVGANRVWRVDPHGTVTSIAGTGVSGSTGDGGPATRAEINAGSVSVGPDGTLYLDDMNRFRSIDPRGVIHAFAGTGVARILR